MVVENYTFPRQISKNYINTFSDYMNCRFLTTKNKKEGGEPAGGKEKKPNFCLIFVNCSLLCKKKALSRNKGR
jgi:hypothetical protein